jgi:hypothetical protein
MMHYQREEWQDPRQPITGPKPKARRSVGVLHYSGSNSIPGDKKAWLRSMQNDYVTNRGYSLGYGHLVCANGDSYEIRGDDFNMASNNGDKVDGNANDWTLSILLDVTTTSSATPAQIERCKQIFNLAGITGRPVPHSFYDYTSCCGATVTGQINAGLFDPTHTEPEPPPSTDNEEIDMLALDFGTPGVDSWWTRLSWQGDTLCHVVSPADQLQTRGKVPVVSISEKELNALLDSVMTVGPSPFGPGQAPNSALDTKWTQARGRT